MKRVPRTPLLVWCLALAGGSCDRDESRTGPLALLADSVMQMASRVTCTSVESSLLPGVTPHRECRADHADTAILLGADASGMVVIVSREWLPRHDHDYEQLRERLVTLHALEHITHPSDDLTFDSTHLWEEDGYHVLLARRRSSGRVYLAWILGSPVHE